MSSWAHATAEPLLHRIAHALRVTLVCPAAVPTGAMAQRPTVLAMPIEDPIKHVNAEHVQHGVKTEERKERMAVLVGRAAPRERAPRRSAPTSRRRPTSPP